MSNGELFRIVSKPYFQALLLERWDAPPGRYFCAYRARHGFRALLGHGVVDEFRTISAPILLAPSSIMGRIYDTGLMLADARDPALPIDRGWPPLTVGIDTGAPPRPRDWQLQMLATIKQEAVTEAPAWENDRIAIDVGDFRLDTLRCRTGAKNRACIVVSNAPLLPQQLERLADADASPITIAVSTGNRLAPVAEGESQQIAAVSEDRLADLVGAFETAQKSREVLS